MLVPALTGCRILFCFLVHGSALLCVVTPCLQTTQTETSTPTALVCALLHWFTLACTRLCDPAFICACLCAPTCACSTPCTRFRPSAFVFDYAAQYSLQSDVTTRPAAMRLNQAMVSSVTRPLRHSSAIPRHQLSILRHLCKLLPSFFYAGTSPITHMVEPCDPLDVCFFVLHCLG